MMKASSVPLIFVYQVNEFAISPSPVDIKTIDGKKYSIYKLTAMGKYYKELIVSIVSFF